MNWSRIIILIVTGGAANLVPPLFAKLWPKWDAPVDNGVTFRNKRLLGDHKTWRGLVTGTTSGFLVYLVVLAIGWTDLPWWLGAVAAGSAMTGDMVKSFFKRQAGVKSGKSWFPWDQTDWLLGMITTCGWYLGLGIKEIMLILAIGLLMHMIVKIIGYWVGINRMWI